MIHTVGPIEYDSLNDSFRQDLKNCYTHPLDCAVQNEIRSLAFCCISTGESRFPNEEAARIAIQAVTDYLKEHEKSFDRIIFNVFQKKDKEYYEGVIKEYDY